MAIIQMMCIIMEKKKNRTFECESWDIIYPITRNSFNFLYPKSYICEFENDYNNY